MDSRHKRKWNNCLTCEENESVSSTAKEAVNQIYRPLTGYYPDRLGVWFQKKVHFNPLHIALWNVCTSCNISIRSYLVAQRKMLHKKKPKSVIILTSGSFQYSLFLSMSFTFFSCAFSFALFFSAIACRLILECNFSIRQLTKYTQSMCQSVYTAPPGVYHLSIAVHIVTHSPTHTHTYAGTFTPQEQKKHHRIASHGNVFTGTSHQISVILR